MNIKEFYTISEVCETLKINSHNLRYWEKKGLISPIRIHNAQRRYTKEHIILIEKLKDLIIDKKIGPKGVKGLVKKNSNLEMMYNKHYLKNLKDFISDLKKEVKLLLKLLN
ncbi:MAG: MerR family transcriptional regulator [Elusimicrobiota bacterium]|jgi:DNA-binding transcriptional MerR regulator|nr:MerR family transcriptional regulator [Elusimicrobiota bacterium]